MEYVTLNNGVRMPKLGLGVMQMTDPQEAEDAIVTALQMGYPMIDTAAAYGNEEIVGRAIARADVERKEIFVTSKLWVSDMSYEGAKRGLAASLEKLGLDYLDLFVLHQPIGDIYGAWRYLEEAYNEGLVRAIGVDNFSQAKVVEFSRFNEVKPAVNLLQVNPVHQRWDFEEALTKRNIQMVGWQPFAAGDEGLLTNETLKAIGDKHGKSVAQVILRWLMQRDVVALAKSINPERMAENLAIFDFRLDQEDMEAIGSLDQGGGFALPESADAFEGVLNMWEDMFGK